MQLDKFNTFRGKDKKERPRADRAGHRPGSMQASEQDIENMRQIEEAITKMPEKEFSAKFDQMLVSNFATELLNMHAHIRVLQDLKDLSTTGTGMQIA